MNGMSRFHRNRRFLPMASTILSESGWTGRSEMSSFHGLSLGKICSFDRTASASGVLNSTAFGAGAGRGAWTGGLPSEAPRAEGAEEGGVGVSWPPQAETRRSVDQRPARMIRMLKEG